VYRSDDPPPYEPARLRSPAGMMKMVRDDYLQLKLAGKIYISRASKQFHINMEKIDVSK
jgi:hypothetical protein